MSGFDGPVSIQALEGDDAVTYGWWTPSATDGYSNLQKVIDSLKAFHDGSFPFDGIISFSQGAKLAHLLAQHADTPSNFPNLKFLIMASCYADSHPTHHPRIPQATPSNPINIPTLHVVGSSDCVVPPESSGERRWLRGFCRSVSLTRWTLMEYIVPFLSTGTFTALDHPPSTKILHLCFSNGFHSPQRATHVTFRSLTARQRQSPLATLALNSTSTKGAITCLCAPPI